MFGGLKRATAGAPAGRADPPEENGVPIDLADVPGAFEVVEDLPRPHWETLRAAADALPERYDPHRVRCEVQLDAPGSVVPPAFGG